MNNTLESRSYKDFEVLVLRNRNNILYKILITLVVFCFITLFIYGIIKIEKSEPYKFILPYISIFGLIIFFLVRKWLWSLFGAEHIILCETRIIHFHKFGIIKTQSKIIRFDKLGYSMITFPKSTDKQLGLFILVNQPYKNIEPDTLLQTSIILEEKDINLLAQHIYSYYKNQEVWMDLFSNFICN